MGAIKVCTQIVLLFLLDCSLDGMFLHIYVNSVVSDDGCITKWRGYSACIGRYNWSHRWASFDHSVIWHDDFLLIQ